MSKWKSIPKPLRIILWTILGILGVAAMGVIFGFGIMWLWNWLMPVIFGLGEITYWQAIGIFVLAKLIFGFGTSDHSESKSKKIKTPQCDDHSQAHWTEYESWWETEGKKSFEKYKDKEQEVPGENV